MKFFIFVLYLILFMYYFIEGTTKDEVTLEVSATTTPAEEAWKAPPWLSAYLLRHDRDLSALREGLQWLEDLARELLEG